MENHSTLARSVAADQGASQPPRAVVLLSGGLDSATTAAWALLALCFIDAKRAAFEINAVKRLNGCFRTVFHFYEPESS